MPLRPHITVDSMIELTPGGRADAAAVHRLAYELLSHSVRRQRSFLD